MTTVDYDLEEKTSDILLVLKKINGIYIFIILVFAVLVFRSTFWLYELTVAMSINHFNPVQTGKTG